MFNNQARTPIRDKEVPNKHLGQGRPIRNMDVPLNSTGKDAYSGTRTYGKDVRQGCYSRQGCFVALWSWKASRDSKKEENTKMNGP